MFDPELHEDLNLIPYQRELFPTKDKLPNKKLPNYKTRGQVHGYSTTPFDKLKKPDWLKESSGKVRIIYE